MFYSPSSQPLPGWVQRSETFFWKTSGILIRKGVNTAKHPLLLILDFFFSEATMCVWETLRVITEEFKHSRFLSLPPGPEVSLVLSIPWDMGSTGCYGHCGYLTAYIA